MTPQLNYKESDMATPRVIGRRIFSARWRSSTPMGIKFGVALSGRGTCYPVHVALPSSLRHAHFSFVSYLEGASHSRNRASSRRPAPTRAQSRSFFIQTEPTPNPNSLKFLPGRAVLPADHGTGVYFTRGDREKSQSPLASALLALDGVTGVFLGADFITISKGEDGNWSLLKPVVFGAVMDFFAEGKPVMLDEPLVTDTTILDDDDEVVAMIKELLQERVRPAVQEDGGDIFYKGFDHKSGIVSVQLAGSCSGCPSSTVTLKNGVENMLMHYIPEVTAVNAVEDDELKEVNEKEANELEDRLKAAGVPFER